MGRQLKGPGGEKGSKVVSSTKLTTTRGTLLLLLMCWEMAGSSKRGPSARRPKSWAHTFTHPKPKRIQSPKRLTQSCRRPAQERSCLFRNRSFINAIKICPIMNLPKKAHLPSQPIAAFGKTMATNGTLSFYGRLLVPLVTPSRQSRLRIIPGPCNISADHSSRWPSTPVSRPLTHYAVGSPRSCCPE